MEDLQEDNTQAHDPPSTTTNSATNTTHIPQLSASHLISDQRRLGNAFTLNSPLSSHSRLPDETALRCCCGRLDCAYLRHNNAALGDLEHNLETAARLGQALLQRHETYVADSEADRARMVAEMERLERDRQEMQSVNARIVEENRNLLEQLEGFNNAVASSDDEIKALVNRLEQTQLEMRELAASAARAADLESQLNAMEAEQMELQQQLILTQEDEKSAMNRWKKAEITLRDMQDQLDRLELDARAEREEHAQIIERMERRRAVERELDGAAGRLKGAAAAASTMDRSRNTNANVTTPVVSKFVRDILQDNANLQMGIVELRELLESSNQEVENLREQILHHQPLSSENTELDSQHQQNTSRLDQELSSKESRPVSQEFHVHHHYHSPSSSVSSKKEKQTPIRRPKKRRQPLMQSGVHTPRSSLSSPSHYHHHDRTQPSSSSTSTIISQTSVSIPQQRYSMHPSGVSSLASSPISAYQPSSIFDIVDQRSEISRPSSPESPATLASPKRPFWKKRLSDASSIRSFTMPAPLSYAEYDQSGNYDEGRVEGVEAGGVSVDSLRNEEHQVLSPAKTCEDIWLPPAIPEEQEETLFDMNVNRAEHAIETEQDAPGPAIIDTAFESVQFKLRKPTSYESLLSVSGMDIHTLRDRPSQLLAGYQSRYFYQRPPLVAAGGTEVSSTTPVISTTNVTADKASIVATPTGSHTSHSLLASFAAKNASKNTPEPGNHAAPDTEIPRSSVHSASNPVPIPNTSAATTATASTLSRKVGGWVKGKWGIAPLSSAAASPSFTEYMGPTTITSNNDARHADAQSILSTTTTDSSSTATTSLSSNRKTNIKKATPPPAVLAMRGFGINQKGPIPGFLPNVSLPASKVAVHVGVDGLNKELLDESLRE